MSYNVSTMRVKHLDLTLPRWFSYQEWVRYSQEHKKDFADGLTVGTELLMTPNGKWFIDDMGFELHGTYDDDGFKVGKVVCRGEGSWYYYFALMELLKLYGGVFHALVVWEGGDSVQDVHVKDGVLTEKEL